MKHITATRSQYLRRLVPALFRLMMAAAVAFIFLGSASAQTAIKPSGKGTEGDPYQITVVGNLAWMSDTVASSSGKYYKMMNDIDASETAKWDNGKGFVPIGNYTTRPSVITILLGKGNSFDTSFKGTFDGNNKKITGLTINRPDRDFVGLFGVTSDSTIKNLGLEDFTIVGRESCGGLAGNQGGGSISNCYSSGNVSGSKWCGGLVGSQGGSISNCYSTGSVRGSYSCGGLVGYQSDKSSITNCYSTVSVSGTDGDCGGLVGNQGGGSISNCYSTGSVSSSRSCGGLVGHQNENSTITNCYSTGSVSGNWACGGLVGNQGIGEKTVNYCYYNKEAVAKDAFSMTTSVGSPKTLAEMKQQATFSGWDFANVWKIVEGTSYPHLRVFGREDCDLALSVVGAGTIVPGVGVTSHSYGTVVSLSAVAADNYVFAEWIGGPVADPMSSNTTVVMDSPKRITARFHKTYEIRTLSELQAVKDDLAGYYILMNDIDASETAKWNGGKGFVPIGSETAPFKGTFDGNNKKIKGLTIKRPDTNYIGLFGKTDIGSQVKNLGLEDFTIAGYERCGGLVGALDGGSISNCYSTGIVSGYHQCGGLVGYQSNSPISNCYSTGRVSGNYRCGGLIGYQEGGSISNCYSTGSVSGGGESGGLVGDQIFGTENSCYYDRETSGQSDTGKGTPKTTAEMKQQATFSGWDFENVWKIVEGASYPYLSGFGREDCDLTLSVVGTGTVVPEAGVTAHSYGAVVSLSAVAADNYTFGEWLGGPVADPTSSNTTVVMDSSKSITARFRKVYEIRTLNELQAMKDDLAGHYILMNDIDASETASWNGGKGFVPIGSEIAPFKGAFDGNNKKITGLTIKRMDMGYIGLFGKIDVGSTIKDLGLEDFSIAGEFSCGGLVGYVSALSSSTLCITNCYTSGRVSSIGWPCGGLVGFQQNGSISDCYSTADVNSDSKNSGGLVGYVYSGSVSNCYSTGRVSGNDSCGGLVGYQEGGSISNCYSTGCVSGHNSCGGLAGDQGGGSISNCYSTGSVSGGDHCAGLVGHAASGTISNCYSIGSVSGTGDYCSGLAGLYTAGATNGCYYDTETSGQSDTLAGTPKTTAEMKRRATFSDWDFATIWGIKEKESYPYLLDLTSSDSLQVTPAPAPQPAVTPSGSGTETDPYLITVVGNLAWMSDTVTSSSGKYYKMMNDIDASETAKWDSGKGFVPIGSDAARFEGVFDGNNKKVTGLTIDRPDRDHVGLFGRTHAGSTIKNLGLENFTIVGRRFCGGLAGAVSALSSSMPCVTNCYTIGSVRGSDQCGGLVGYQKNGSISNSYSSAGVRGSNFCGGLVGCQGAGSISNCYSSGSVSGDDSCGGLVGYQKDNVGSISDCYSSGSVNGTSRCGGLVGRQSDGPIKNCHSTGSVSGTHQCGGLVGLLRSGSISQCYSSGSVTSTRKSCGGLVGYIDSGSISDCYSTGRVDCPDSCGGLVGFQILGSISNCYSTGRVSLTFLSGGIVGFGVSATVNNCYYDTKTSKQMGDIGKGTPKTTAEMKERATFSGWDFATIWGIKEKESYPYLLDSTSSGSLQVAPAPASLPTVTPAGSGTETDPYLITVVGNLAWMSDTVTSSSGKHYKMMNDIDASETAKWDSGKGFVPIGSYTARFAGVFDGNNKKITGLTIDRRNTEFIGLFGWTNNSTIKNLGLENFTIAGRHFCGGLAGYQGGGSISSCYSSGSVSATGSSCGGLVACQGDGFISNCYSTGCVSGGGKYYGGLVGAQTGGSISNSYSTVRVSGNGSSYGGLVGYQDKHKETAIGGCYYDTKTGGQSDVGKGTPKTTAEMKEQATFSGWDFASVWGIQEKQTYPYLLGLTSFGSLQVTLAPAEAVASGAQWSINGGVTWNDSGTTVTGLPTADYTVTYKGITDRTSPESQKVTITDGVMTTVTGIYIDPAPKGSGTEGDPYQITVLSHLVWMSDTVTSSSGKYYKLMNDLDASGTAGWDSGKGFAPIGSDTVPFEGIFDGNNKKITGLTINRRNKNCIGLFGRISNSTIKNLGLEDLTITGRSSCGGLVGSMSARSSLTLCVTNCYTSGRVSGEWSCGGLVGHIEQGSISNCHSTGSVSSTGRYDCGGLVGYQSHGSISNCYSTASVSGTGSNCGGLAGSQNNGSISNCYATGSVSGGGHCGGLLGYHDTGSISNCYSTGSVSGNKFCGGLFGYHGAGVVINGCYYDTETSGQSDTGKGTPKTTAEMKQQATFSGWDFAAIWGIKEKESYPYLLTLPPRQP